MRARLVENNFEWGLDPLASLGIGSFSLENLKKRIEDLCRLDRDRDRDGYCSIAYIIIHKDRISVSVYEGSSLRKYLKERMKEAGLDKFVNPIAEFANYGLIHDYDYYFKKDFINRYPNIKIVPGDNKWKKAK